MLGPIPIVSRHPCSHPKCLRDPAVWRGARCSWGATQYQTLGLGFLEHCHQDVCADSATSPAVGPIVFWTKRRRAQRVGKGWAASLLAFGVQGKALSGNTCKSTSAKQSKRSKSQSMNRDWVHDSSMLAAPEQAYGKGCAPGRGRGAVFCSGGTAETCLVSVSVKFGGGVRRCPVLCMRVSGSEAARCVAAAVFHTISGFCTICKRSNAV